MIVWGGWNGSSSLNTGGRYSPSTDSWTATNAANAPEPRYVHTAAWTGIEMIVWGGYGAGGYSNTGGRYNPSIDNWTATTTTNAPDGRGYHTAVWTGSQMVIWGGYDGNRNLNTGGRYCAQTGFTPTPTPTLTPQPTPTPSEPPCEVIGSQPACNSIVSTQVTDFTLYLSYFITGAQPSDFTVNGTPADSASVVPSSIIFHFNASPVLQGENSMHIPRDAFFCINGRGVDEFRCTFTYQPSTPTPTQPPPTATPTATATHTPTGTPTSTSTPTATPTLTPRPSPTPRPALTPRPRPTPPPRP